MPEYLVHIKVLWPVDGDPAAKEKLIAEEGHRAKELSRDGTIIRLWRVPGRWENWGVWQAADATRLHSAITSLPLYPWLDVEVTALAEHPSDPGNTT